MASSSGFRGGGGGHWFEPWFDPLVGGGVISLGVAPIPSCVLQLRGVGLL